MRKLIALFLVVIITSLAITPLMFKAYSVINCQMTCCEKSCADNQETGTQSNNTKNKSCKDDFCCPISCTMCGGNIFMALYKDKEINITIAPSYLWNELSPVYTIIKSNYSADCFHPPEMV